MRETDIKLSFFSSTVMKEMPISLKEENWAINLPCYKSREYKYSRGLLRRFLSSIFRIPALEIKLHAPPGKPPILENDLGFVSISHCKNGLLLGWSNYPLGVDVEQLERKLLAKKIINKFYTKKEKIVLRQFSGEELRRKCLDLWVIKESSIKSVRGSVFHDLDKWEYSEENGISYNSDYGIEKKIFIDTINQFRVAIAYDSRISKDNIFVSIN